MLIRFRVSNFLSFRDEVELSMITGRSKDHPEHILPAGTSGIQLLRSAVIYGANASGKSNLVKAAAFAQNIILESPKPQERIPLKPFLLEAECAKKPAKFEFEFCQGEKCYLYGFETTPSMVLAEWLYEIKKTTQKMIFERTTDQASTKTKVEINRIAPDKRREFLQEFASGTRPNQLFLSKCHEDNNVTEFDDVAAWFTRLIIVFPGSKYTKLPVMIARDEKDSIASIVHSIVHYLEAFDTGVCGFETQPLESAGKTFPKNLIEDIKNTTETGVGTIFDGTQFFIFRKNEQDDLQFEKIVFQHQAENCNEKPLLDIAEESDGTLRLIDLIPILQSEGDIFLVDELDRSLHPSLSYQFLELFLANKKGSQVVVTTHEAHLLNLDLLRRDEIWFIEKERQGVSRVYSLEEFAPRHDKDVQKGYLLGRYGAIPVLGSIELNLQNEEVNA